MTIKEEIYETICEIRPLLEPEPYEGDVLKHYTHTQSDHGNWARGGLRAGVADSILARVRENGGLSVNMVDGSEPTSGYMVAKGAQFGSIVSADDFYDPIKGPKALADYFKKHKKELGAGKNYLGVWHNKDDGQVYLDVSENIQDRERAISAGQKQDQISIWDVINFAEIETGGTGSVEKTGSGRDTKEHRRDDRFGDRSLRSENLGEVGKAYKVIRFEPGLIPLFKHQEHDQKTHGNWASGNYDNLAEWFKDEAKVFESETDKEVYFMSMLLSQRLKGFTEMAYPEFSMAISAYEGRTAYDMNEALRDDQISDDGYKPIFESLDKAIETAPPLSEELVAYRGVKGNGLDFFESLEIGQVYEDKGFTSTTIDPGVAQQFGGQQPYYDGLVFRYKLPAGTKGIFPSGYHEPMYGWTPNMTEAEFLLPRGSKFKVVAKRGKVWDVELVP